MEEILLLVLGLGLVVTSFCVIGPEVDAMKRPKQKNRQPRKRPRTASRLISRLKRPASSL